MSKIDDKTLEEINSKLAEILQDIVDCIKTSDKFEELYFISVSCNSFTGYKIRHDYIYSDDMFPPTLIMCYYNGDFKIEITNENECHIYKVNVAENVVNQTLEDLFTGETTKFDNGLNLEDFTILERVLKWCKTINPNYW